MPARPLAGLTFGGDAGVMDEQADQRPKSPFAIPEHALVGDVGMSQSQLVILQPHQPPNDWAPSCGDAGGAGGDGD